MSVGIQTVHGRSIELTLLTVLSICEPITRPPLQLCLEQFGYFKDLELAYPSTDSDTTSPDILIGMYHYWDLVIGEVIQRVGGPVAMHTHVGWVLSGPLSVYGDDSSSVNLVTHVLRVDSGNNDLNQRLERRLRSFWELEFFGIQDTEFTMYEQFASEVQFQEGRYKVKLPWKDPSVVLSHRHFGFDRPHDSTVGKRARGKYIVIIVIIAISTIIEYGFTRLR